MAVSDMIIWIAVCLFVVYGVLTILTINRRRRRDNVLIVMIALISIALMVVEGSVIRSTNRDYGPYVQVSQETLASKDGKLKVGHVTGVSHWERDFYRNGIYRDWDFSWSLNILPVYAVEYQTAKQVTAGGHVYPITRIERTKLYPDAWVVNTELMGKTIRSAQIAHGRAIVREGTFAF